MEVMTIYLTLPFPKYSETLFLILWYSIKVWEWTELLLDIIIYLTKITDCKKRKP